MYSDKCDTCSYAEWIYKVNIGTCPKTRSIIGVKDKRFNSNINNDCLKYQKIWWFKLYEKLRSWIV